VTCLSSRHQSIVAAKSYDDAMFQALLSKSRDADDQNAFSLVSVGDRLNFNLPKVAAQQRLYRDYDLPVAGYATAPPRSEWCFCLRTKQIYST